VEGRNDIGFDLIFTIPRWLGKKRVRGGGLDYDDIIYENTVRTSYYITFPNKSQWNDECDDGGCNWIPTLLHSGAILSLNLWVSYLQSLVHSKMPGNPFYKENLPVYLPQQHNTLFARPVPDHPCLVHRHRKDKADNRDYVFRGIFHRSLGTRRLIFLSVFFHYASTAMLKGGFKLANGVYPSRYQTSLRGRGACLGRIRPCRRFEYCQRW
jgi:hypothetical protein